MKSSCPLPEEKKDIQDLSSLKKKCREVDCFYLDCLDSDYLPYNCDIFLLALLNSKKGKNR